MTMAAKETAVEALDLPAAARPECNVVDSDGVVVVDELATASRGSYSDVTVWFWQAREVVSRLVVVVNGARTQIAQPSEHAVEEVDRPFVIEHCELDVMNTAPSHSDTLRRDGLTPV
jgi:hypothetical protein